MNEKQMANFLISEHGSIRNVALYPLKDEVREALAKEGALITAKVLLENTDKNYFFKEVIRILKFER